MGAEGHERYREELAAYLLGALDEIEAREFERHLSGCATCQADERWLRTAVDVLPSSVEQIEPPPQLRERLLDTVQADARQTAPTEERTRRPRGSWFGIFMRPAVAMASVALLFLGGIGGYLLGSGDEGGGGESTVAVQPTGVEPGAGGELVKAEDYPAVLRVTGLPQEPGRIYEVWIRRKGSEKVEPSSLFAVSEDGTGSAAIPHAIDDVAEVMVSSEPEGGSAAPTTKPVLQVKL
jgi:anti-sigma-K factor RskA